MTTDKAKNIYSICQYHFSDTGKIVITSSTVWKHWGVIRFHFAKEKVVGEICSEMVEDDSELQMFIAHLTQDLPRNCVLTHQVPFW